MARPSKSGVAVTIAVKLSSQPLVPGKIRAIRRRDDAEIARLDGSHRSRAEPADECGRGHGPPGLRGLNSRAAPGRE